MQHCKRNLFLVKHPWQRVLEVQEGHGAFSSLCYFLPEALTLVWVCSALYPPLDHFGIDVGSGI